MNSNKIEKAKKPAMVVLISIVVSIIVLIVGIQEDIPVFITGYGEVKTFNVVPIAPEVTGKIVKIHSRLEAGEIIPKGEILFKIDPRDYMTVCKTGRDRLRILKRSQELAKKEYERVRVLFEKNSVGTQAGVEAAEKAMLSASDLTNQIA
jgi:multidrug resistance efflux pump